MHMCAYLSLSISLSLYIYIYIFIHIHTHTYCFFSFSARRGAESACERSPWGTSAAKPLRQWGTRRRHPWS